MAAWKAISGTVNLFLRILPFFFPLNTGTIKGKKGTIRRKRFRLPDFAFWVSRHERIAEVGSISKRAIV